MLKFEFMHTIDFPSGLTEYHFHESITSLKTITVGKPIVVITDKNIYKYYRSVLESYKTIVIPPGEHNKSWKMIKQIAEGFIQQEVDRNHFVVGIGGGVVTDIAGFAATTYMRGLDFGFIPTSLLAMVDAAVGGKNGVNVGVYKNMMGTIHQPNFLLYNLDFLQTLPHEEWSNGFAEIIKYGCIFDEEILLELQQHNIDYYKKNNAALQIIIEKCVALKNKTVLEDEHEKGIRKLLNFGHTIGHAIENEYNLSHGQAVSIGMIIASKLSEKITGFKIEETNLLETILQQYELPTSFNFNTDQVMEILKMDKKRNEGQIDFIVLEKLGGASIRKTAFDEIEDVLRSIK